MKSSKYIFNIIKRLEKKISPKQDTQLNKWLAQNEDHKEEYDLVTKIWQEGEHIQPPPLPNVDDQWLEMQQYILRKSKSTPKVSLLNKLIQTIQIKPSRRLVYAFCTVLLLVCFAGWQYYNTTYFSSIVAKNSQRKEIEFSDGSHALLNSGSKVKYKKVFSETRREITLQGEAFFRIVKDERPLTVTTDNARIIVLGTQFNVWSRDRKTRVFVKEGKVKLQTKKEGEHSVVLTKGQKAQILHHKSPSNPTLVNVDNQLGWLGGRLVFEKTSLEEVAAELERHFDTPIKIGDKELRDRTLTATFEKLLLKDVVTAICLSLGIEYQFKKNKYILIKKNPTENQEE